MDLRTLHKDIVYKTQGTPYSLTRTITKNGQPDILFHWHTDVELVMFMRELRSFTLIMITLIVKQVILSSFVPMLFTPFTRLKIVATIWMQSTFI